MSPFFREQLLTNISCPGRGNINHVECCPPTPLSPASVNCFLPRANAINVKLPVITQQRRHCTWPLWLQRKKIQIYSVIDSSCLSKAKKKRSFMLSYTFCFCFSLCYGSEQGKNSLNNRPYHLWFFA
jgi:hypothetical protein